MAWQKKKISPSYPCYGQVVRINYGGALAAKCFDFGSLVVNVYINNIFIPSTLSYIGISINFMTQEIW